jgi:hypothetical protein
VFTETLRNNEYQFSLHYSGFRASCHNIREGKYVIHIHKHKHRKQNRIPEQITAYKFTDKGMQEDDKAQDDDHNDGT